MTLDELEQQVKQLKRQFPGNTKIHKAYPSHDHWHTTLAPELQEITSATVAYSTYHQTTTLTDTNENDDDPDEEPEILFENHVIILQ